MKSILPLNINDIIIIAPSARFVKEEDIEPVRKYLESSGFRVIYTPGLFSVFHQFAGKDQERARSLQWALDHEKAKAILMARGGYGTVRVLDKINLDEFKKNPKLIIGFSDVTALHAKLNNAGFCSLHAPLASTLLKDEESAGQLITSLLNQTYQIEFDGHPMNRPGYIKGKIVGGNLSVIYSLSGSKDDLVTKDKILFLEDVDEYLYHIDRMMQWLDRSGKLKDIGGLLVGGFSEMKDHEIPFGWNAMEIICEIIKKYDFPVAFGVPSGHEKTNLPLFFERYCEIEINKIQTLIKFE
jgi:muramoyltetrapeptide carboxypeptidase